MKPTHLVLLFSLLLGASAFAADPAKPLAEKGAVVFSDNFARSDLGGIWKTGIPVFTVTGTALKGSQARDDHGAAIGATLALPDGNVILELRFRLDGANSINVGLDDKSFQGVHAGHISRVVIRPNRLILYDDKEGTMRNDIYALRKSGDPKKKAEGDEMCQDRTAEFPLKLEQGIWYRLGIEIVGDQMRVTLDDKEAGRLKSSGLAHPTKPDLRLGVWGQGKDALIDDVRIWSAKPVSAKQGTRIISK